MNGLAAESAQQTQQVSVEQVLEMLMQGADPEQLLKQGIPMEIIEQALQIIMQQQQQGQQAPQQPAQTEAGLAMSASNPR